MPVAFGVRKDYEDRWLPGVVAVGDESVNLAELLEAGDGVIVVADDQTVLAQVLEEQLALKRVPLQSAEDKARTSAVRAAHAEYGRMSVPDLQKAAKTAGVDVPASANKKDYVDALAAHVEANWKPEEVTS